MSGVANPPIASPSAAVDEFGNSLLHVACQNNNRRIAKLLLKCGANVDCQNYKVKLTVVFE